MKKILVYGLSVLLVAVLMLFAFHLIGCGRATTGISETTSSTTPTSTLPPVTTQYSHEFIFVTSGTGGSSQEVSVYSIEASGNLSLTDQSVIDPPAGQNFTYSNVIIHPSGQYLYINAVTNTLGGGFPTYLTSYNFDSQQGKLTPLTANLSLTNISITPQFVIDPSGQYAYVPTEGTSYFSAPGSPDYHKIGGLDIYSITGGALVFYASQEVGYRGGLFQLHPSGKYAYLFGNLSYPAEANLITVFSVNSGILASTETISFGQLANNSFFNKSQIDPTGKNLFALIPNANQIAHVAINPTTGLFSGTPEMIATTGSPISIAFHPSGQMAYVVEENNGSGTINLYPIDPTTNLIGAVKSIDIPSATLGGIIPQKRTPGVIVVDPAGKVAYILDSNNNNILIYRIEANGDLTKMAAEISSGPHPHDMVVWGK